jgi:hypothetical protein
MKKLIVHALSLMMFASITAHAAQTLQVKMWTGSDNNAGTDDRIYVTVHGLLNSTEEIHLDKSGNDFEKNSIETYEIEVEEGQDIGDIVGITVKLGAADRKQKGLTKFWKDNTATDGWQIKKIQVWDSGTHYQNRKLNQASNKADFFQRRAGHYLWLDDDRTVGKLVQEDWVDGWEDRQQNIWSECNPDGKPDTDTKHYGYTEYFITNAPAGSRDITSTFETTNTWSVGSVLSKEDIHEESYSISTGGGLKGEQKNAAGSASGTANVSASNFERVYSRITSSTINEKGSATTMTTTGSVRVPASVNDEWHVVTEWDKIVGKTKVGTMAPVYIPINWSGPPRIQFMSKDQYKAYVLLDCRVPLTM